MKSNKLVSMAAALAIFTVAGCYTQLMAPKDFVQSQHGRPTIMSDATYQLNYNQNCTSCHSIAELDDRYLELKYYGVMTVHNGIMLDPISWNNSYTVPVYEPDPYGWYNPAPAQPWWNLSPATSVSSNQPPPPSGNGNRVRENGSTRDNTGTRERTPSNPAPVQATPQQPAVGTTTTTPSVPPPATTVTTPPAPQSTSSTPSSERKKSDSDSGTSTNRTRSNGSSRDDNDGNRRR